MIWHRRVVNPLLDLPRTPNPTASPSAIPPILTRNETHPEAAGNENAPERPSALIANFRRLPARGVVHETFALQHGDDAARDMRRRCGNRGGAAVASGGGDDGARARTRAASGNPTLGMRASQPTETGGEQQPARPPAGRWAGGSRGNPARKSTTPPGRAAAAGKRGRPYPGSESIAASPGINASTRPPRTSRMG